MSLLLAGAGPGTSGVSWTPATLTGLQLWLDPTTGHPGASATNDPVATWNDRSANAYSVVQATTAAKPLLGVFPNSAVGIVGDGVQTFLKAANATPLNSIVNNVSLGYYFAAAFQWTGNTSDTYGAILTHNHGTDAALFMTRESGTGKMMRFNGLKTASAYTTTGGTPHIMVYAYDHTSGVESIWMDGGSPDTLTATPGSADNVDFLTIGATNDGFYFWHGLLGDIVVGSGDLSTSDRNSLTAYLKTKYGVA